MFSIILPVRDETAPPAILHVVEPRGETSVDVLMLPRMSDLNPIAASGFRGFRRQNTASA